MLLTASGSITKCAPVIYLSPVHDFVDTRAMPSSSSSLSLSTGSHFLHKHTLHLSIPKYCLRLGPRLRVPLPLLRPLTLLQMSILGLRRRRRSNKLRTAFARNMHVSRLAEEVLAWGTEVTRAAVVVRTGAAAPGHGWVSNCSGRYEWQFWCLRSVLRVSRAGSRTSACCM